MITRGGRTYPTDTVAPPPKLCSEDSTWLQDLLNATDNTDRIPFAPVENGVAENFIEFPVLN